MNPQLWRFHRSALLPSWLGWMLLLVLTVIGNWGIASDVDTARDPRQWTLDPFLELELALMAGFMALRSRGTSTLETMECLLRLPVPRQEVQVSPVLCGIRLILIFAVVVYLLESSGIAYLVYKAAYGLIDPPARSSSPEYFRREFVPWINLLGYPVLAYVAVLSGLRRIDRRFLPRHKRTWWSGWVPYAVGFLGVSVLGLALLATDSALSDLGTPGPPPSGFPPVHEPSGWNSVLRYNLPGVVCIALARALYVSDMRRLSTQGLETYQRREAVWEG